MIKGWSRFQFNPRLRMTHPELQHLTPRARQLVDAGNYDRLVAPARALAEAHQLLDDATPEQLLDAPFHNAAGHATVAGFWLWHDGLHECHEIVQRSPDDRFFRSEPAAQPVDSPLRRPATLKELTATFSFWHAVMHRREGDFGNSKYWYAKCAGHSALAKLAEMATPLFAGQTQSAAIARLTRGGWDAYAFVDFVEAACDRPAPHPDHQLAIALQRLEWRALMAHTIAQAIGD